MTKFATEHFQISSEYVTYGSGRDFVARFKYNKGSKKSFVNFLIKNFTVEEYFTRLQGGEAPLTILESKGYLLPHIKKLLKTAGYEVTTVGYKQYIQDQVKARIGYPH